MRAIRLRHLLQRVRLPARAVLLAASLAGCATASTNMPDSGAAPIPALEAQLARDSTSQSVRVRLGAAYRREGRLEDARRLLSIAFASDSADAGVTLLLGLVYEELNGFAEARRLYERFLERGASAQLKSEVRSRLALLRRRELELAVRSALARETELASTAPEPSTVAVFPFAFAASDSTLRPLTRALADFLVTDLSQTDRLRVLERTQVQVLLDEMNLVDKGSVDDATAARTGRLLGAGRIVQGQIAGNTGALRLEALVVPVGSARPPRLTPLAEQDNLTRLLDAQKRLALGIYRSLGVVLTAAERERVNRRPTENIQAILAYGEGLEAHDAGEHERASRLFQRAAELDPSFEVARQRSETSQELATALRVTPSELAEASTTEMHSNELPSPAPDVVGVETMLDALLNLVPTADRRDAAAETLGSEGVVLRAARLRIRLLRP